MDQRLVTWARAVKSRHGSRHRPLWLFTDATRLPDPLPAIARLPRHLCGVIFRHDGIPNRIALAQEVAHLCRQRALPLSIAGDWRLAHTLRAGVHLRTHDAMPPYARFITASAHTKADLQRAQKLGALIFLSPVFPTLSHRGAPTLGACRWSALARGRATIFALGGIDGQTARRLIACAGAGAIAALA